MKINKDKYPILDWLDKDSSWVGAKVIKHEWMRIRIEPLLKSIVLPNWGKFTDADVKNLFFVSQTFADASDKNVDMFEDLTLQEVLSSIREIGVLLLPGRPPSLFRTYFYYDYSTPGKEYCFIGTGDIVHTILFNSEGAIRGYSCSPMHNWSRIFSEEEEFHMFLFMSFSKLILFKKYAKVETRVLNPSEKIKDLTTKEKHLNGSKYPVTILDCTWFTNTIRNSPFGVRGHFRLQPKKDASGNWTKELIYIEPFMKKGYNIKAKKTI